MKRGLLIFCLLAGLLLPCLLPVLNFSVAAATTDEEEPLPEETAEYRKDTIIMTETTSMASASSGDSSRWNKVWPASTGNSYYIIGEDGKKTQVFIYDPLDKTRTAGFARYAPQEKQAAFSLGNNKLSANSNLLISAEILLPGEAQSETATSPLSMGAELFGTTLFTMTEDGDRYGIDFGSGMVGSAPKGVWLRVVLSYNATTKSARAAIKGELMDANDAPCEMLDAENIACALANSNMFRYTCSIPAKTSDDMPESGFYQRTSIRIPGDMYLLSAGLKAIEGDTALNTSRDGDLTLTFTHDIDSSKLDISKIRVTDKDGNALPVTSIRQPIAQTNCLVLNFASDPLPKFTTVLVHYDAGVTDFAGQSLLGDAYAAVDVYGDKGDLRPKMPIVEIPEEKHIMPDVYNTGYRCSGNELEPLLEKYPLLKDHLGYGGHPTTVNISDNVAKAYNYRFEKFTYTGSLRFTGTHPITIEDAYLHCEKQHYAIENIGTAYLTISYLEGTGSQSSFIQGGNMKLSHIYLHDVGGDHMKAGPNQWLEYSYFRDGGTHNPQAHADCIQFSGTPSQITDNIVIIGNRMDIPPLLWDHTANSTLFFKTEGYSAGYTNVQMIGNWLNGGGFTAYLTIDSSTEVGVNNTRYITFKDNMFGYGGRWGSIAWGKKYWPDGDAIIGYGGEFSNNDYVKTLDVGSVLLRDSDGTVQTDLAGVRGGTLTMDVHFANYLRVARQYRIAVRVIAGDGTVLAVKTADGNIRKYIHYDEYATPDNIEDMLDEDGKPITYVDGQGNVGYYRRLINLPDLPEDVLGSITLSGLPDDLSGCRAEVVVYDTTGGASTEVRKVDFIASGTYGLPLAIEGASLTLTARPEINFYVAASELAKLPAGATLYLTDGDGGRYVGTLRDGYMIFSVRDILVSDMGREREYRLQYRLADGDGTLFTSRLPVTYSPLTYAIRMYQKTAADDSSKQEALRSLLVAMVQYAEAAGSAGAKARFASETGYAFGDGEVGDYAAIRAKAAKIAVDFDSAAGSIASVGATLGSSIDLVLSMSDARYTSLTASIGGEQLIASVNGTEATVSGLWASDLYGVITFTFSGEGVDTVTATLTVAHFLDGHTGGKNATLARATALYMEAVLFYVNP